MGTVLETPVVQHHHLIGAALKLLMHQVNNRTQAEAALKLLRSADAAPSMPAVITQQQQTLTGATSEQSLSGLAAQVAALKKSTATGRARRDCATVLRVL